MICFWGWVSCTLWDPALSRTPRLGSLRIFLQEQNAPWEQTCSKGGSVCSVFQLCMTLCDPMDCSLPGSSVHGSLRQEYCSGLPFPSPGDCPDPGIKPSSPALRADALPSEPLGKPSSGRISFPGDLTAWGLAFEDRQQP